LTAQNMIASSKGLGGPQRAEVERMLAAEKASLVDDQNWVKTQHQKLAKASADLDAAFRKAGQ
jgi:argininosuccinate lyase